MVVGCFAHLRHLLYAHYEYTCGIQSRTATKAIQFGLFELFDNFSEIQIDFSVENKANNAGVDIQCRPFFDSLAISAVVQWQLILQRTRD